MLEAAKPLYHKDQRLPREETIPYLDDMDVKQDEIRWMAPGTTVAEMKELAESFLSHHRCSYSTFLKRYNEHWAGRLKVRCEGQHAQCTSCAKFKKFRQQVSAPEDVQLVIREYSEHLRAVMADRREDCMLNARACISVGSIPGSEVEPQDTLLSMCVDAMDAAKFRVPRNLAATKEFQNLWRPELTFVGAIVEGLTEHYCISDLDVSKNANLQATIVGMALQQALKETQARGKPLPRHLRIHTDNASGEGKNQTMMYLAAWLCYRHLFDSVMLSQFRVGHSHGKPDQRFSEVRFALSQCSVLQTPEDFAAAITDAVRPREGRNLRVEYIKASYDFAGFFKHMPLKTSGHTQTKGKTDKFEEAVHVFHFTRRDLLPTHLRTATVLADGTAPTSDDIILTCRQHLASSESSQPPFVFATPSDFHHLPDGGPQSLQLPSRVQFSDRQIKEFEKTAWKISQAPWKMDEACAYLLKMCEENKDMAGEDWLPPEMSLMLTGKRGPLSSEIEQVATLDEGTFQWNRLTPAQVTVTRLRGKQPALRTGPLPPNNPTGGAPATLYGRNGAPARVVADIAPTAKAKAGKGKGKGKKNAAMRKPAAAAASAEIPSSLPPSPPASLPPATPVSPLGSDILAALAGDEGKDSPRLPPSEPYPSPSSLDVPGSEGKGSEPPSPPPSGDERPAPLKRPSAAVAGPEAQPVKKRQLGRLPKPPGVKLGCGKCRVKVPAIGKNGCAVCRAAAGLILNADETAWVHRPDR